MPLLFAIESRGPSFEDWLHFKPSSHILKLQHQLVSLNSQKIAKSGQAENFTHTKSKYSMKIKRFVYPSGLVMASQVEGGELDLPYGQFFWARVKSRDVLGHAIVLEHVQECCFTGVVETQEEKLAGLFPEAQVRKDITEPIPEKHLDTFGLKKLKREQNLIWNLVPILFHRAPSAYLSIFFFMGVLYDVRYDSALPCSLNWY